MNWTLTTTYYDNANEFLICKVCNHRIEDQDQIYGCWCDHCEIYLTDYFRYDDLMTFDSEVYQSDNEVMRLRLGVEIKKNHLPHLGSHSRFDYDDFLDDIDDDINDFYDQSDLPHPKNLSMYSTLCCDKAFAFCKCTHKKQSIVYGEHILSFNDIYEKAMRSHGTPQYELYEFAYSWDENSNSIPCTTCVYYGTYKCFPLRNWLKNIADKIIYDKINLEDKHAVVDPCNNFEPNSFAKSEDIEAVRVILSKKRDIQTPRKEKDLFKDQF